MVEIKHKQQVNDGLNWKCGSVCLEMIFEYYGIEYDSDNLWESVKVLRPSNLGHYFSLASTIARYSIKHGLDATIYQAKEDTYLEVLQKIDSLNIPAILQIRQEKSNQSHFVVYKGINNKMFYYCDPDAQREFSYFRSSSDIKSHWKNQPNIDGYMFIVFGNSANAKISCAYPDCGKNIPIVHDEIEKMVDTIYCPHCNRPLEKISL